MAETIAFLTKNKNNYSVFKIGDLSIKFYTSPNLQRYCNVTRWKNNGYIEVVDLSDTNRVATIQGDIIAESVMSDEEDANVLSYYLKNKEVLEESLYA